MIRRLEFREGTSNKFWQIETGGRVILVRFGRIGTEGRTQTKTCASEETARKKADALLWSKLRKGYVEPTGAGAPAPDPRRPARSKDKPSLAKRIALPLLPKVLRRFVNKPAFCLKQDLSLVVFDWHAVPERAKARLLGRLFGDCDLEAGDYRGLLERTGGKTRWVSDQFLPFALQIARGDWRKTAIAPNGTTPQIEELYLLKGNEVHAIAVDGTAIPALKPRRRKGHFTELDIRPAEK
jgi:predicted DNA-binding WGR domain protein